MEYNVCGTCGAGEGRAGMLIKTAASKVSECLNCVDTRKAGKFVIHANLSRTQEELELTGNIL